MYMLKATLYPLALSACTQSFTPRLMGLSFGYCRIPDLWHDFNCHIPDMWRDLAILSFIATCFPGWYKVTRLDLN